MSSITSINGATDSPSSGVGIINTNFTNLNTDKLEATQSVTLTNKTINASNNTISNITAPMIATASKSGVVAKLITGTPGVTNDLAKWNSAGDLVAASLAVTTATPTGSSTNSTIPTSAAVYSLVASANANTTMFIPWVYTNGTPSQLNDYSYTSLNSGQIAGFNFMMPSNMKSFTSLEIIMIPDTSETITWTETMTYAVSTATYGTITKTDSGRTASVTINLMTFLPVATGSQVSQISGLTAPGQMISFNFTSGTTLLRVLGLRLTYGV